MNPERTRAHLERALRERFGSSRADVRMGVATKKHEAFVLVASVRNTSAKPRDIETLVHDVLGDLAEVQRLNSDNGTFVVSVRHVDEHTLSALKREVLRQHALAKSAVTPRTAAIALALSVVWLMFAARWLHDFTCVYDEPYAGAMAYATHWLQHMGIVRH